MRTALLSMVAVAVALPLGVQLADAQTAAAPQQGGGRGAPMTPPKDVVDIDLRAVQRAARPRPPKPMNEMTPQEVAEFQEAAGIEQRQRALAFLALYPDDPRRWNVVNQLNARSPRFVLEWSATPDADNRLQPAKVDEAAAAAWKVRVEDLQAQMKTAADLPEDLKQRLARDAETAAQRKAFFEKWRSGKEKAAEFITYTVDNKPVKLSDYRGKVVVIDFWASWCGPCKEGMPHRNELAEKYRKQGVVVLGSGTYDPVANLQKFIGENHQKYANVVWSYDKAGETDARASFAQYGVYGLPTQFVIDRKGYVVDVVFGYAKGEVIVDGALAKAGIQVDPATLAQADADRKKRPPGM